MEKGHAVPNYLSGLQYCYGLSKSNGFNPALAGVYLGSINNTDWYYNFKSKHVCGRQNLRLVIIQKCNILKRY